MFINYYLYKGDLYQSSKVGGLMYRLSQSYTVKDKFFKKNFKNLKTGLDIIYPIIMRANTRHTSLETIYLL